MEDKLHPSVKEFKQFLANHPELIKEIRKNGRSWQEHYEKWVLLGEEDPYWTQYKEKTETEPDEKGTKKQSELFSQLLKLTENMDINKVQHQIKQLSSTISTIQEVLGQFQETKETKKSLPETRNNQPFNWFRD
ncbi:spore coat protein YlbD [Virgibacillus sp. FSP13]